jgi:hypothetical protein
MFKGNLPFIHGIPALLEVVGRQQITDKMEHVVVYNN